MDPQEPHCKPGARGRCVGGCLHPPVSWLCTGTQCSKLKARGTHCVQDVSPCVHADANITVKNPTLEREGEGTCDLHARNEPRPGQITSSSSPEGSAGGLRSVPHTSLMVKASPSRPCPQSLEGPRFPKEFQERCELHGSLRNHGHFPLEMGFHRTGQGLVP